MRRRSSSTRAALRRQRQITLVVALVFVIVLVCVEVLLPDMFGMFIAIGGTAGALMVIYEVRLTKQIAQAEFIRDLQTSFTSDEKVTSLWQKLLNHELITDADRADISNYLTFFETLHILQSRGALDLPLTDDLFRNRFFTAIGDKGIQDVALMRSEGSFANVHALVADWHEYLVTSGKPVHEGYYRYIKARAEHRGYELTPLTLEDLPDVMALQEKVINGLKQRPWLRRNSEETFHECLAQAGLGNGHAALGYRRDGELVAAGVLYEPGDGPESIAKYVSRDEANIRNSVNLKVIFVAPEHRGNRLARTVVELLEHEARVRGRSQILCTIHPQNMPSRRLFGILGYRKKKRTSTAYGTRYVFARPLPRIMQ